MSFIALLCVFSAQDSAPVGRHRENNNCWRYHVVTSHTAGEPIWRE